MFPLPSFGLLPPSVEFLPPSVGLLLPSYELLPLFSGQLPPSVELLLPSFKLLLPSHELLLAPSCACPLPLQRTLGIFAPAISIEMGWDHLFGLRLGHHDTMIEDFASPVFNCMTVQSSDGGSLICLAMLS